MSKEPLVATRQPLLVHYRNVASRDMEVPTLDDVMPYSVSRARTVQTTTKLTRVKRETTDDE